jgi:hypothetical protein
MLVSPASAMEIHYSKLPDGVELWSRSDVELRKPTFFAELENLFNVVTGEKAALPFDRSVAFLVGVSKYQHLGPQLPFVENDVRELREFLLNQGGFDRVYVALNAVATRDLVEEYMANLFRQSLGQRDRLLFYYAGHGADLGGTTGYMQFSPARPDDFARHVLPIHQCVQWSKFIPAKHIVFIYDCCASGLAFTSRANDSDSHEQLVSTLSGSGSRTVITAGTSDEKTYEVKSQTGKGNGVFTRALLDALQTGEADRGRDGFMTMDEIFAQTYVGVREFAEAYAKSVTPRIWKLEESRYRGTFVFLNPAAQDAEAPSELSRLLQAQGPLQDGKRTAGRSSPPPESNAFGSLSISSDIWAEVRLDDGPARQTPAFFGNVPVGPHQVRVTRAGYEEQMVEVLVEEASLKSVRLTMQRKP